MNIIDHRRVIKKSKPKSRVSRLFNQISLFGLIIVLIYSITLAFRYNQPLPAIKPETKTFNIAAKPAAINWPSYGQSAVGDLDSGILASSPNQIPKPTASVAKIMTALAIMRQKPFSLGQPGATLTLTSADVDIYNKYISLDGSVVSVSAGEKITQYQGLQAMLLPSSNNMADTMASWAFGSIKEYATYANGLAKSLGMNQTNINDASGFSPQTISTAHDLVILGQAALKDPVIAEIVSQSDATIPVHGNIRNVNTLLNLDGINGIKTGNTEEAGGCFLVSAIKTLDNGDKKTIIAAVMGAPQRSRAMQDSQPLLNAARNNYVSTKLASKGDVIGYYDSDWGETATAVLSQDVTQFGWVANKYKLFANLNDISINTKQNEVVGTLKIDGQTKQFDVILNNPVNGPTTHWKWRRAYQF